MAFFTPATAAALLQLLSGSQAYSRMRQAVCTTAVFTLQAGSPKQPMTAAK